MTWLELVTLLGAAVWNLVSYLLPQLVALPGLTPRQAVITARPLRQVRQARHPAR